MADETVVLRHTAAQVDDGIDKANAAAPQDNTYTKQQVDDAINSKSVSINAVGDNLIIITN